MQFVLTMNDITMWLAVMTIILLVTSELLSSFTYYDKIAINRRLFRHAALILGMGFMITVILRFYQGLRAPIL